MPFIENIYDEHTVQISLKSIKSSLFYGYSYYIVPSLDLCYCIVPNFKGQFDFTHLNWYFCFQTDCFAWEAWALYTAAISNGIFVKDCVKSAALSAMEPSLCQRKSEILITIENNTYTAI